ncbi:MAG: hypothetical protein PHV06_08540 [bacterium]|nr:hypothetical protein [bacterium]
MRKYILFSVLFALFLVYWGCTPLEENVIIPEEKDILEYSHTWKDGDTYAEFSNPALKGTVLFFTYEINAETKNKFSAQTVNSIYEVSAIVLNAQKTFEPEGIKFLYIDSIANADLLKQFKVKTPPVVVILDNTGTQVHRFNPAAKSMISSSFSTQVSLDSSPSEQQDAFDSGMIDTVNRTMGAELENVLKYLIAN